MSTVARHVDQYGDTPPPADYRAVDREPAQTNTRRFREAMRAENPWDKPWNAGVTQAAFDAEQPAPHDRVAASTERVGRYCDPLAERARMHDGHQ